MTVVQFLCAAVPIVFLVVLCKRDAAEGGKAKSEGRGRVSRKVILYIRRFALHFLVFPLFLQCILSPHL